MGKTDKVNLFTTLPDDIGFFAVGGRVFYAKSGKIEIDEDVSALALATYPELISSKPFGSMPKVKEILEEPIVIKEEEIPIELELEEDFD